jgi:signal transduction histidine kinase/ActR/RegA family two-component response regulator
MRQWWLDRPVRVKGMIVIAVPLFTLIAITLASLVLQYNERQERQVGQAASTLSNSADQVLADAVNAETGLRGYAATADPSFLGPYYLTLTRIGADATAMRAAAVSEGDTRSVAAVATTTSNVMAQLAQMRTQISAGVFARALESQLASANATMGTLRSQVADLTNRSSALLAARRVEISRMEADIDDLTVAGLGLGVLSGVLGIALFASGISTRVVAAAANASRLGAGQALEPVGGGGDELGQLADALAVAETVRDSRAAELDDRASLLTAARDEALKATQVKNAFLSSTSHELRTPLNAVLGFTQLLQLSDLGQEDKESVERILAAGRHLLALINELIDIARIESGELSLSVEPVHVKALVEETCQLMAPLAAERSITISPDCADPAVAVYADRRRLSQVLVNLFSNAIKYNHPGGAVSILCRADGPARASVTVADTGPGISDANLERIFVPFERLGAELTGIEGTGIGLPLARAFTEAMGGQLTASSTVGEGSSFTISLPRAPDMTSIPDDSDSTLTAIAAVPASRPGADVRVLYIEDNPANIEVVSRFVKSRPAIRLQSVMSGHAGLDFASQEVPDLILLDLHLPDLRGDEVLSQLKADPATAGIPVAILSAEAAPAVIRHMRDSGVVAYLTKPLDLTELGQLFDSVSGSRLPVRPVNH